MIKPWLNKLSRAKQEGIDRSKYLRLDKNERVIKLESKFLSYLKKSINTFNLTSYPNIDKIYKLLSKKINVPKKMLCLTAGSDLAIKTCIEYFTKRHDKIITLSPTFGMVDVYTKLYNLKNIQIGYDKNLNLNIEKLEKNLNKKISLIIIANPNSPTGTIIDPKKLLLIIKKCEKIKVPILIDEAYFGFYKLSYIKYINRYNNLIVTRTFSKAFGLAGLRAGYIAANSKVIRNIFKYKPMYEINAISCIAIEFLLKNPKIVKEHINEVEKGKKFLIQNIKKKYEFIDTYGNFFHINFGKNKNKFEKMLKKNKILVRKGPGVKGFEGYLRISLGSKKHMNQVLKLMKKI